MLEWLTSIPGILISCGVLLLIVSVVVFIVTSKKGETEEVSTVKEEKPEVKSEEPVVVSEPEIQVVEEAVEVPVEVEEPAIEIEKPNLPEETTETSYVFEEEKPVEEVKTSAYGGYNPLDSIKRNIVSSEESVNKVDTLDE